MAHAKRTVPLHDAIFETRRAAGLTQRQLGKLLGATGRAVMRWEMGARTPTLERRDALVRWLRGLRGNAHADDALVALGVVVPASALPEVPAPPPPPAPSPPPPSEEERLTAKHALDHALFTAAEADDVPARAARRIVASVLAAVERSGVSVAVARELLARPEKGPATRDAPADVASREPLPD